MTRDCCNDFSRSRLLHRAVAEAGRGLPSIEPGMPLPAGTGMTRRTFVSGVAGFAVSVYGGSLLAPRLLDGGIAEAAADRRRAAYWSRSSWRAAPTRSRSSLRRATTAIGRTGRRLRWRDASARRSRPIRRAPLAPGGRVARDTSRGGQAHRLSRRRLHERRRLALHVAALLGGRRDGRRPAHGVAGPLPRPRRRRRTTRSRG